MLHIPMLWRQDAVDVSVMALVWTMCITHNRAARMLTGHKLTDTSTSVSSALIFSHTSKLVSEVMGCKEETLLELTSSHRRDVHSDSPWRKIIQYALVLSELEVRERNNGRLNWPRCRMNVGLTSSVVSRFEFKSTRIS